MQHKSITQFPLILREDDTHQIVVFTKIRVFRGKAGDESVCTTRDEGLKIVIFVKDSDKEFQFQGVVCAGRPECHSDDTRGGPKGVKTFPNSTFNSTLKFHPLFFRMQIIDSYCDSCPFFLNSKYVLVGI